MPNILDILARAQSLMNETALNSITPPRAGGIMYDTLLVLNQMQLEGGSLLISKIYTSVSAMEADTTPTSDLTGRALRAGQLAVIVPADTSSADLGKVYRFNSAGSWSLCGKIGGLPFDTEPADGSTNGITSGAVYDVKQALEGEVSQLDLKVDGLYVNVGTWSVGSVNNPSSGHIPDYASNRRLRTAELTIPYSATYNLKVNSGYKFGLIVVAKRETLIWDSELTITLAQGDVYRIVLREDPDPTNTNIYSGWTQEQIDDLVSASGFDMFANSKLDELKEELEQDIEQEISNLDLLSVEDYSTAEVSDIWPRPKDYVTNGLVFFLDGKDFVAGQPWVDKIGSVSFAMTDAAKDGNGVRFNGTSARGVSTDTTDFPSQSYTIEMVVKLEKAVSASADSQVVFNSAKSGGFALGYGYQSSKKVFTNQAGTTSKNISYEFPGIGLHRYSVNKNVSVLNGNTLTKIETVGNWGVATSPVIGSTYSGSFYFKGVIYAIRVYNRLLTEDEMKQNQMFDLENYNL